MWVDHFLQYKTIYIIYIDKTQHLHDGNNIVFIFKQTTIIKMRKSPNYIDNTSDAKFTDTTKETKIHPLRPRCYPCHWNHYRGAQSTFLRTEISMANQKTSSLIKKSVVLDARLWPKGETPMAQTKGEREKVKILQFYILMILKNNMIIIEKWERGRELKFYNFIDGWFGIGRASFQLQWGRILMSFIKDKYHGQW